MGTHPRGASSREGSLPAKRSSSVAVKETNKQVKANRCNNAAPLYAPKSTVHRAVIAGLAHGYAFGETVLGANLDVTATYMAGVVGTVVAITVAVMLVTSKVLKVASIILRSWS